jgi:hypothetical protein
MDDPSEMGFDLGRWQTFDNLVPRGTRRCESNGHSHWLLSHEPTHGLTRVHTASPDRWNRSSTAPSGLVAALLLHEFGYRSSVRCRCGQPIQVLSGERLGACRACGWKLASNPWSRHTCMTRSRSCAGVSRLARHIRPSCRWMVCKSAPGASTARCSEGEDATITTGRENVPWDQHRVKT